MTELLFHLPSIPAYIDLGLRRRPRVHVDAPFNHRAEAWHCIIPVTTEIRKDAKALRTYLARKLEEKLAGVQHALSRDQTLILHTWPEYDRFLQAYRVRGVVVTKPLPSQRRKRGRRA